MLFQAKVYTGIDACRAWVAPKSTAALSLQTKVSSPQVHSSTPRRCSAAAAATVPLQLTNACPLKCKSVAVNKRTSLLRSLTRPMPPTCSHLHLQVHRRHVATPLTSTHGGTLARSIAATAPTTSTRRMLASRAGIRVAVAPRPTDALSPQTKVCSLEVHSSPPQRYFAAAATVPLQPTATTFPVRPTWLRS